MSQPDLANPTSVGEASSESLTELNVESRIVLAYAVTETAVRSLLPQGWTSAPAETGPSQGANLTIIFSDRLLVQNSDGQPLPDQATNQLAVVVVPAHQPDTAARGVMIVFGISARVAGAPG